VRVDFDAENHRLVFSSETVDMTFAAQNELRQTIWNAYVASLSSEDRPSERVQESFAQFAENHEGFKLFENMHRMRQEAVSRLRHQAMPALIASLRQYGEENPSLLAIHAEARATMSSVSDEEIRDFAGSLSVDVDECTDKADVIGQLLEKASSIDLCSTWAARKCSEPKCVCGSRFQRIDAVERFRRSPDGEQAGMLSDEEIHQRLKQLHRQSIVICDICEGSIPAVDSFVWTCENRTSTILHATSYDVCESCFVKHACHADQADVTGCELSPTSEPMLSV